MHDVCPCKIFPPDASFGVSAARLIGWVPGGVYSAFLWIRSCPWVPDGCVIPLSHYKGNPVICKGVPCTVFPPAPMRLEQAQRLPRPLNALAPCKCSLPLSPLWAPCKCSLPLSPLWAACKCSAARGPVLARLWTEVSAVAVACKRDYNTASAISGRPNSQPVGPLCGSCFGAPLQSIHPGGVGVLGSPPPSLSPLHNGLPGGWINTE
jgi:hypothetical protein